MTIDARVEVLERAVVFDGFFRVVRFRLRHRLFAGGMSGVVSRELFDRGDAVVVLPYDPLREEIVLVEQFRLGALEPAGDPWLLEPVAGIIEPGEEPDAVARREAHEEAGLELLDLVPIGKYFPSPGGSNEICTAYLARIDSREAGGLFGLADHGEDVRAQVVPLARALDWLARSEIRVASTLITLQWLALHRSALRARWGLAGPSAEA